MPNALFVTRNFPPLAGGMERLNHHAYQALREAYSMAVCGPGGAGAFVRQGDVCVQVPVAPLSRFLLGCQWAALRMAWRTKPGLVYSGSGLTAPAALMAGRATGAKTACFLHGLDIVADHPVYRRIFLPAIRRFDRILVNSRHTAGLAAAAGVAEDRIAIVHPGVALPEWSERTVARQRFRERFGLGSRPLLLAAGRLTQRKGLAEFIRNALPEITRLIPNSLLVIVGTEPQNALKHSQGVTQRILQEVAEAGLDAHVALLGAVDDACLSDAYYAADVMVFPVLDLPGDVEGFGMVAVEAAAHGLPTVGFALGGVPDAVAENISGHLVPSGNYAALAQRIMARLQTPGAGDAAAACRQFAAQFAWERFGQKLRQELATLVDSQVKVG